MAERRKLTSDYSVAELIAMHHDQIQTILSRISGIDYGGTCIVDELFVLRFILSDKDTAEEKIVKALEWRRIHRDAIIEAQQGRLPFETEMAKHVKRGTCGWLADQFLLLVVRAGLGNSAAIMRELNINQCAFNQTLQYEQMFAILDEKTRRTGKLCQLIFVIDLQGFSMRTFDRKFAKSNGETSYWQLLLYPSIIRTVVIINLPATFRIIFSLARMFTSRTMLERQKICPARTLSRSAAECPFLASFGQNSYTSVPHFLGGTYPLPESLRLNDDEMDES